MHGRHIAAGAATNMWKDKPVASVNRCFFHTVEGVENLLRSYLAVEELCTELNFHVVFLVNFSCPSRIRVSPVQTAKECTILNVKRTTASNIVASVKFSYMFICMVCYENLLNNNIN